MSPSSTSMLGSGEETGNSANGLLSLSGSDRVSSSAEGDSSQGSSVTSIKGWKCSF